MRLPQILTSLESTAEKEELNRVLLEAARGVNAPTMPEFTVATRPAAAAWRGKVIFVSDGGAGAVFQGSNGTSWVNLG